MYDGVKKAIEASEALQAREFNELYLVEVPNYTDTKHWWNRTAEFVNRYTM